MTPRPMILRFHRVPDEGVIELDVKDLWYFRALSTDDTDPLTEIGCPTGPLVVRESVGHIRQHCLGC